MTRAARAIALAILFGVAALVVYIVSARFDRVQELEWMEGAMLDHVERFQRGEPLYVKPSLAWTPILYPPGYFWLSAKLATLLGAARACRAVSLASTVATTVMIHLVGRRLGASRFFALVGALSYVACFGFVLQWFDAQRTDPLFLALAMASALVMVSSERARAAAFAGALLGCAFFVKQQAGLYLAIVPASLLLLRRARPALVMASAGGALVVLGCVWLQASSGGWFSYYVFHLPSTHGMEPRFIPGFLVWDLGRGFLYSLATLAFAGMLARKIPGAELRVYGAFLLAAFAASTTTRLHPGSWDNNMIHWCAFASPALAAVCARLSERAQSLACALAALSAVQFAPNPARSIPREEGAIASRALEARVRELEKEGEVLLLSRGHVTEERHAHYQALNDLTIARDPIPDDYLRAIETRALAAIVVDELERLDLAQPFGARDDLYDLVARNYEVTERIPESPPPILGFGSVPRWILRPRKERLDESHAELTARIAREAAQRQSYLPSLTP